MRHGGAVREVPASRSEVRASLCVYGPHQLLESPVLTPAPTPSPAVLRLPPPLTRWDVHPSTLAPLVYTGQSRPDILSHSSARAIPEGIY